MSIRSRSALAIAAVMCGAAIASGPAATAVAAPARQSAATQRVDACFNGACGSATYKRTSSNSYNPVNMSVKDNKCDGHPVYIQAGVQDGSYPQGYVWLNTKHYNNLGCHGGYASWSSYIKDWHLPIRDLIFRVCVDDWGSDTCKVAY
jgi:hypothetical protein